MTNRLVAILTKDSLTATIGLEKNHSGVQVKTTDPRRTAARQASFVSEAKARRWMREAVAESEANGWTLGYFGPPLNG